MSSHPVGFPIGLEVPAKDVARASAFYTTVFNWKFEVSHLGIPAHKLMPFTAPGGAFPIGGAMRMSEDLATGAGRTKIYLYVEDMSAAKEAIEQNGGKMTSDIIPEGSKGYFQFFDDTEGNNFVIYTYQK